MSFKYFIYRFKYVYAKYLPLKVPVDITLELSSFCNQRCKYCYHSDQDNLPFTRGHMSFETAKKIIDSAAECGVNSLKFNWRGEPTLNPYFADILKYAESKAKGSTFIDRISNTNMNYNPKREDIYKALKNQTLVKASIDSIYPRVMREQRTGSHMGKSIANFIRLHDDKSKKCKLSLQAVVTSLNKNEKHAEFMKKYCPTAKLSIRNMVEGRTETDCKNLTNVKQKGKRVACNQAFYRLVFDWEGNAMPCCVDYNARYDLGNIHEMSVKEIFNSVEANVLRTRLKYGSAFRMEPCKSCSSFESYEGWKPSWNP